MKRTIAIITAALLGGVASAAPSESRTADYSSGTAPALQAYQANVKEYLWTLKNAGSPVNLTANTPFMYRAAAVTSTSCVTARCVVVSATGGTFKAIWTAAGMNSTGNGIYGVGTSSNGNTVCRQGALALIPSPYSSGVPASSWSTNVFINNYNWTGRFSIVNLPLTVLTNVTAGAGISITGTGRTRAIAATGTLANHAHTNRTDSSFGWMAGSGASAGSVSNFYFGRKAGLESRGSNNVFVGVLAGVNSTGTLSTAIGLSAGSKYKGGSSTIVGEGAATESIGGGNTYVGKSAGLRAHGTNNSYFGFSSGVDSHGVENDYIGQSAGSGATGNGNAYLGRAAGAQSTSQNNTFVGLSAGYASRSTNSTYLGRYAGVQGTGNGWLYIDSYTNNPYGAHVATNDSIVIDPQGRLHLGRPAGTMYLRATNWIGAPWLDTGGDTMSGALNMGDQAVEDTKYIDIKASVPSGNPASGYARLYADTVNSQEALYWKQADGSSFRIGRDLIHTARNADTVVLTNGVAVYWWTNMTTTAHWMKRAKADDGDTMPCQGIVTGGNIATGATGTVMWQGRSPTGYVTTAAAYATPLYVSDVTAGALVTTPPLSPSYRQQVGFVNYNGAVDVRLGEQQIPTAASSSFRSFQMWSSSNSTVMTGAKALRTLDYGNPPSPNLNTVVNPTNNQYISYCTLPAGLTQIAAGIYQVNATIYRSANPDTISLSAEIYTRTPAGVLTELTAVAGTSAQSIGATALEYIFTLNVSSNTTIAATDSVVLRFKVSNPVHSPTVYIGAGFLQVPVPSSQYVTTAAPTITGNLNLGGYSVTNGYLRLGALSSYLGTNRIYLGTSTNAVWVRCLGTTNFLFGSANGTKTARFGW